MLDELARVERLIPPEYRPEPTQLWNYASAKYGNARAALDKLNDILEDIGEPSEVEDADDLPFDPDPEPPPDAEPPLDDEESPSDFEDMRGAARQAEPNAKAHKSQVDYLRSLCEELAGQEGVRSLEKRLGKPLKEFTQEEADRYIDEYSPKGARDA